MVSVGLCTRAEGHLPKLFAPEYCALTFTERVKIVHSPRDAYLHSRTV